MCYVSGLFSLAKRSVAKIRKKKKRYSACGGLAEERVMFVRTKGSAESCVYKASYELWSMVELWSYSDYVHSCLFGYSSDDTETRNDTELLCTQLGTQQKIERKQYNREIWTKTVVCVLSINAGPLLTIGYGPVLVVVQLLLTLSFCHYLHGAPTVKAVRDGQWDETRPKQTTTTRRDGCVTNMAALSHFGTL